MQVIRQLSTWIILLMIFLSRLPFIGIGYGSEEDAWGLRVTAESISRSGNYEVSRLPGHPFQELIYSQLWQFGPLAFNLLTLLLSIAGIAFFIFSLKKLNITSYNSAGLTLAFTPIIYINSLNAMDYTWAMSLVLIAFYLLISGRILWAGIFLGCAVGCRLTSGAMLLPFIYYILTGAKVRSPFRDVILICSSALLISALLFLPVFLTYGTSFFSYYEHFSIPSVVKNFYKGTIGVWGLIGFIAICAGLTAAVLTTMKKHKSGTLYIYNNRLFLISAMVIILYIISFYRLPLKSAFLIPIIPFVILILAQNLKKAWMSGLAITMIISCFAFGINLSDPNRGSAESSLAFIVSSGEQNVSIDPLIGLVLADYTKQKKMIDYSKEVISVSSKLKDPSVIISGWYLNFILTLQEKNKGRHDFVYYVDETALRHYKSKGVKIYYLAGQNIFNDLRFNASFTDQYAEPLEVKDDRMQ